MTCKTSGIQSTRTKSTRTQVNSYPNAKETQSNVIIILVLITA